MDPAEDPLEDPGPAAASAVQDAAEAETPLMDVVVASPEEPAVAEDAAAAAAAAPDKQRRKSLLLPYWRLLRTNTDFALLFTANVIVELGNWCATGERGRGGEGKRGRGAGERAGERARWRRRDMEGLASRPRPDSSPCPAS